MTELLQESIAVWQATPTWMPPFERTFSRDEQAAREMQLVRFFENVQGELRSLPRTRSGRQAARERISAAFAGFARAGLEMQDAHLELLLRGGFSAVGTDLARQARRFDPGVKTSDIFQASRNAWTACSLQMLLGRTMQLTPSIFAYSMLYPYTDNLMDDPDISREAKLGFSNRFGRRLAGDAVNPANGRETTIWRLIELIEKQYNRADWPQVFASLLRIHRAQENSLRLVRRGASTEGVEVLQLSFEKGGASVMADGYLAAGPLSEAEARFVFLWGVLLQLADDLQDVNEDRRDGALTLFSVESKPLDELTNRTFHFARKVMPLMDGLPGSNCRELVELIERSSWSLLIRSAGETCELYTKEYLAELETHSPFRFSFLNDRRKQLGERRGLLGKLFEAFLAGDEDEPAFPLLPPSWC